MRREEEEARVIEEAVWGFPEGLRGWWAGIDGGDEGEGEEVREWWRWVSGLLLVDEGEGEDGDGDEGEEEVGWGEEEVVREVARIMAGECGGEGEEEGEEESDGGEGLGGEDEGLLTF